jgi:hypothetical protein
VDDVEFMNLIKHMLIKNHINRHYQIDYVKNHLWFKNFEWEKLEQMSLTPIYIPVLKKLSNGTTSTPYLEFLKVKIYKNQGLKEFVPEKKKNVDNLKKKEYEKWYLNF